MSTADKAWASTPTAAQGHLDMLIAHLFLNSSLWTVQYNFSTQAMLEFRKVDGHVFSENQLSDSFWKFLPNVILGEGE